jgi:hypothetical protein
MSQKKANLSVVQNQRSVDESKTNPEEQRKKAEEPFRLTRSEIAARVRIIRQQVETNKACYDGVIFETLTTHFGSKSLTKPVSASCQMSW